jgi:hypothetical protein
MAGNLDQPLTTSASRGGEDPWGAERYQFYGPTGSASENAAAGSRQGATAQNERLQYDNPQNMTLSTQDQQKMMALWANANGMDANDQKSYTQLSQSADGKSIAVGPFKLDAGTIANDWLDGMVNGQGLVDRAALENYIQQGKISPETAEAVSSPEFMRFMQKLAAGQQPTAEDVAKFLPTDLQQAIAGDLANAGAAIVGMQGGTLDTQSVLKTVQGFSAEAGPMQDFAAAGYGQMDPDMNQGFEITENTSQPGSTYNPDPDNVANSIPVLPIETEMYQQAQPSQDYTMGPDTTGGATMPPDDQSIQ